MAKLEAENGSLARRLEAMETPDAVTLHPRTIESYIAEVDTLASTLAAGKNAEAVGIVQEAVDHIKVYRRRKNGPVEFDIAETVEHLLFPQMGLVVPEGGFEPPTLRFSVACSTN